MKYSFLMVFFSYFAIIYLLFFFASIPCLYLILRGIRFVLSHPPLSNRWLTLPPFCPLEEVTVNFLLRKRWVRFYFVLIFSLTSLAEELNLQAVCRFSYLASNFPSLWFSFLHCCLFSGLSAFCMCVTRNMPLP